MLSPGDRKILVPMLLAAAAGLLSLDAPSEPGRDSISMGHPNQGTLIEGVRLPERGLGFRSNPTHPERDPKYGTGELIKALIRAGEDLARRAPGATLFINDLSAEGGGPLYPLHESHQAGRDADLLFFMLDRRGEPVHPQVVRFDGEGREVRPAPEPPEPLRFFDTRRNWLVLRSLIENEDAHLQRVLVAEPLRELLLDHARRVGAPAWVVERADEVMCDSWSSHDNHFHIRLFCTADDYRRGCRDEAPLYPWRRTELAGRRIFAPELALDPNRGRARAQDWIERQRTRRLWCP